MKSMVLNKLGGQLEMVNLPKPICKPREVLIKVLSTSLNFADTLLILGKYQEKPNLPFAPGMEVCGFVEACGERVKNLKIGERVVGYAGFGGLSEFITLEESLCFPVPPKIPNTEAACLLIAYGSTELALNYKAKLRKNETLLVLGASGGVGLSAIQIGKAMGASVIAVARGEKKCSVAESVGANFVINSSQVDVKNELKKFDIINVVYDPVGGQQFTDALSIAKPETRILPIGFASGEVPLIPANIAMVKNVTIIGFQIGAYRSFKPYILKKCFNRLIEMWSNKLINPQVSNIFSLEHSNKALDLIRNRLATGKVVIDLNGY